MSSTHCDPTRLMSRTFRPATSSKRQPVNAHTHGIQRRCASSSSRAASRIVRAWSSSYPFRSTSLSTFDSYRMPTPGLMAILWLRCGRLGPIGNPELQEQVFGHGQRALDTLVGVVVEAVGQRVRVQIVVGSNLGLDIGQGDE